jgi:hypothetical protein
VAAHCGLTVRVRGNAVADGTPPEAVVFKRYPNVFARSVQQVKHLIDVLFGSRLVSVLSSEQLLNPRKVLLQQEFIRNVFPSRMYLSILLSRLPPSATAPVLDVTNGTRESIFRHTLASTIPSDAWYICDLQIVIGYVVLGVMKWLIRN